MLMARVMDLAFEHPDGRAGRLARRAAVALAVIAAALAALLAAGRSTPGGLPALLHVHGGDLAGIAPVAGPLFWSLAALAVVAAVVRWRRDLRLLCAAFAVPPLLLLTAGFSGALAYAEADSARALARSMPPLPATTDLACLECLPNGLPFYLKRTMTLITRDGTETTSNYVVFFLRRSAAWPSGVVRLSDLDRWLAWRDHAVLLLADARHRPALDSIAARAAGTVAAVAPGWWSTLLPAPPGR